MNPANEILINRSLRVTPCRIFVLNEFLKKKSHNFSELELEKKAKGNFDRVTIYRTLKTFIDSDILHKVMDDDNHIKYAFCKDHTHEKHNHDHIHFKCQSCNTTNCLDEVSVAHVELPKGYLKKEINYLVIGLCPACNEN
jgi:Fur family ferric uptake transcriptional regulator